MAAHGRPTPKLALLRRYVIGLSEGGHATLLRARPEVLAATDTFEPQPDAVAASSRRASRRASIRSGHVRLSLDGPKTGSMKMATGWRAIRLRGS